MFFSSELLVCTFTDTYFLVKAWELLMADPASNSVKEFFAV